MRIKSNNTSRIYSRLGLDPASNNSAKWKRPYVFHLEMPRKACLLKRILLLKESRKYTSKITKNIVGFDNYYKVESTERLLSGHTRQDSTGRTCRNTFASGVKAALISKTSCCCRQIRFVPSIHRPSLFASDNIAQQSITSQEM